MRGELNDCAHRRRFIYGTLYQYTEAKSEPARSRMVVTEFHAFWIWKLLLTQFILYPIQKMPTYTICFAVHITLDRTQGGLPFSLTKNSFAGFHKRQTLRRGRA